MASRYEVEVKLVSATNLKNVNWRNGPNHPYAVIWVEPSQKFSTQADKFGDIQANWDETFFIPLPKSATIEDSMLYIDVLHAHLDSEAKPVIIGSGKLRLEDVHNDAGIGHHINRTLKLKRPSGRPQGAIDVKVAIRDNNYPPKPSTDDVVAHGFPPLPREFKPSPLPAYVSPYGDSAPPPSSSVYTSPPIYSGPPPTSNVSSVYNIPPIYSGPPPTSNVSSVYNIPPIYSGPPPTSNVSSVYNIPPIYSGPPPTSNISSVYMAPPIYGAPPIYSAPPPASYAYGAPYGQTSYGYYGQGGNQSYGYGQRLEAQAQEKKEGKLGIGTGLAIGALAGGLGALALEKGVDTLEEKIADRAAEKVEDDLGFDE